MSTQKLRMALLLNKFSTQILNFWEMTYPSILPKANFQQISNLCYKEIWRGVFLDNLI